MLPSHNPSSDCGSIVSYLFWLFDSIVLGNERNFRKPFPMTWRIDNTELRVRYFWSRMDFSLGIKLDMLTGLIIKWASAKILSNSFLSISKAVRNTILIDGLLSFKRRYNSNTVIFDILMSVRTRS